MKEERVKKSKDSYDQSARTYDEIGIGDRIYYQDPAKRIWSPGTVLGLGPEPRSYSIRDLGTGRHLTKDCEIPSTSTVTND